MWKWVILTLPILLDGDAAGNAAPASLQCPDGGGTPKTGGELQESEKEVDSRSHLDDLLLDPSFHYIFISTLALVPLPWEPVFDAFWREIWDLFKPFKSK